MQSGSSAGRFRPRVKPSHGAKCDGARSATGGRRPRAEEAGGAEEAAGAASTTSSSVHQRNATGTADPVKIGVFGLTCCYFFAQYEDYTDALRLEILQRQLVDAGTDRRGRAGQAVLGETATHLLARGKWSDCSKPLSRLDRDVKELASLDTNRRRSARIVSEVFMRLTRAVRGIWHWTSEHIGL